MQVSLWDQVPEEVRLLFPNRTEKHFNHLPRSLHWLPHQKYRIPKTQTNLYLLTKRRHFSSPTQELMNSLAIPTWVSVLTNIDNTYSCHRYFCRFCSKNYSLSYPHLCPFCQGVCQCSRCLRSDTIFKMKSMYLQLGGDLKKLVHDRFYQELFFPTLGSPADKISNWKKGSHVPSEEKSKIQLIID